MLLDNVHCLLEWHPVRVEQIRSEARQGSQVTHDRLARLDKDVQQDILKLIHDGDLRERSEMGRSGAHEHKPKATTRL